MNKGYIHVYTGNGKGKTTAAIGLAIRAAGAGLKVFFTQFIKKRKCSEHIALERFKDLIKIKQYGTGFIMGKRPSQNAILSTNEGIEDIKRVISSGYYDVIILDEINGAIKNKLIDIEEIINLLDSKPDDIEIVLTGRDADERIVEKADLVTEMKIIKHYWDKGIKARKGIEY